MLARYDTTRRARRTRMRGVPLGMTLALLLATSAGAGTTPPGGGSEMRGAATPTAQAGASGIIKGGGAVAWDEAEVASLEVAACDDVRYAHAEDPRWALAKTYVAAVHAGHHGVTALQHRRHRSHRRSRAHRSWGPEPETYVLLKGGGLHVDAEPSSEGVYAGIEVGAAVEDVLEIGFTLDYFRRASSAMAILGEGTANGLPLRAEATLERSAAHLMPLGVTLRLKLPLGDRRLTPFVSGTLAYDVLLLENQGSLDPDDPLQSILEDEETFTGIGWQAAAGIDVGLSTSFGLFGEVGLHRASPKQEILLDGVPVDLKVDTDGTFLRAGLRVAL